MLRAGLVRGLAVAFTLALAGRSLPAAEFKFEPHVLNSDVGKVCYAVSLADVDGDKRNDIIAVTENRVLWFQNPDWKERVIIADQTERDNVCIAPMDIDGDGQIDFALGASWLTQSKIGTIHWLSRGKSLDDKWDVHFIGKVGWLHRMRWGDFLNTGKPQLTISPLNKTVGAGVRLTAFEIPADPRRDAWKPTIIDDTMNAMHNHWMGDFDGDGKTDIITAAQEGVWLFQHLDGKIVKTQIGTGASDPNNATGRGAGEVKVGKLKGNQTFVVTVEPMHGNQIVVYTRPREKGLWDRHVLDDTLKRGHAIGVADMDRDGSDELVIGHSDKGTGEPSGPGVFIYDNLDGTGAKWEKHSVDNGGIATEDLVVEDLDGDGWIDIVAGGRDTHNVKLYRNLGK